MMRTFGFMVFSPPEHDGHIVELRCGEVAIAEIRIEDETPVISFYSTENTIACTLTLLEFNHAIGSLKSKASEVFGREIL